MKILLKLALAVFLLFVFLIVGVAGWFFLYQGDLPDLRLLAQFAPSAPGVGSGPCLTRAVAVVPAREISEEMRKAVEATESETMPPVQLARFLVCKQRHGNLRYAVDQYRVVWHIRSRFAKEEVLTIYLNSLYFADDTFGVEEASRRFFGKKPNDLNIAEAALLAGMIRNPSRFSPYKHAEEAIHRRNQVIEEMRSRGAISAIDAATAQAEPLGVLSSSTP